MKGKATEEFAPIPLYLGSVATPVYSLKENCAGTMLKDPIPVVNCDVFLSTKPVPVHQMTSKLFLYSLHPSV